MPNGGRRKRGSSLKMWQKILSAALVISFAITAIFLLTHEEKPCCLCDSFRYHAPCLIDLETGEMIELDLYFPHETKVAELSDEQPEMSTFSFVRLGNVTGTKLTDSKVIEIEVPCSDRTRNPALCKNCRGLLQGGYSSRYVLADLYDMEDKTLIPIEDGTEMILRCYEITMTQGKEKDGIIVIVRGMLD